MELGVGTTPHRARGLYSEPLADKVLTQRCMESVQKEAPGSSGMCQGVIWRLRGAQRW